MSTNNKNTNGLTFLAGLIIGGAAIYYLNTPQGKEMTEKVKSKTAELSDQAQELASQVAADAKATAEKLASKTKDIANDIRTKAEATIEVGREKISSMKDTAADKIADLLPENTTQKDFKAGVQHAKEAIQNGTKI